MQQNRFKNKAIQHYLVGGAVRDQLLGIPVKDKDWVVTGATPDDLITAGFKPVGKDFPVFLHPETREEYALARTERKTKKGYNGFVVYAEPDVSLKDDLIRRDLTINAMAQDENNQIIDYYGGLEDLAQKKLRHVSDAFIEDPLRILRVARFAARYHGLGFTVAPETLSLMQEMVQNGEVNALVAERVWQETVKALAEPYPAEFFTTLRACGALSALFPELDQLFGVPQNSQYHPEIDCGIHTLMALEQATHLTSCTETRFAVLTHDLGKGTTPKDQLPKHIKHEERSHELVIKLCERLKAPSRYRALAEHMARYHSHIHQAKTLKSNTLLKVLEATDAFRKPARFEQLLIACEADSRGRLGHEQNHYPQADIYRCALRAATAVNVQMLIKTGLTGEQIKANIHAKRAEAIKQAECTLDNPVR